MIYDSAKRFAVPGKFVMVHTNAFERAIYIGKVEEVTGYHLTLNPGLANLLLEIPKQHLRLWKK